MTAPLLGKLRIKGTILVKTGLHIGGEKEAISIGGMDMVVVKTAKDQIPFIPGSSLKGKLRSLLAKEYGSEDVEEDPHYIKRIFGYSADEKETPEDADPQERPVPTRLIVRDAFLDTDHFRDYFKNKDLFVSAYTEEKWENVINRRTGTAEHPRSVERVPPGSRFVFELIYDMYTPEQTQEDLDVLVRAMHLLQDDYLGGNGSRGYGQIAFEDVVFDKKEKKDYEQQLGWQAYAHDYHFSSET